MVPDVRRSSVAPRFVSATACQHAVDILTQRRLLISPNSEPTTLDVDPPYEYAVSDVDAAWAAGLFAGEGWCGATYRAGLPSVELSISMLDERTINRFARLFDRRVYIEPLSYDAERVRFIVRAFGRGAEGILRVLWPYLLGSDKGDQVRNACVRADVLPWVDGTATETRPSRRERGRKRRPMAPETKAKIAAAQQARWERQRRG